MAGVVRPLIVCGPSGVGKSTLVARILDEFPDSFGFSVSHTTRKPRPGERDGVHYHFTEPEAMRRDIQDGKFLEHAVFGGNLYGTSKKAVEKIATNGKVCLLDIDVQGVKQVKTTDLNPWSIFVRPPSLEALKERLLGRKTETEDSMKKRLGKALEEIEYGTQPGNFDLVIVNDCFDSAYGEFKDFIVKNVLVFKGNGHL